MTRRSPEAAWLGPVRRIIFVNLTLPPNVRISLRSRPGTESRDERKIAQGGSRLTRRTTGRAEL